MELLSDLHFHQLRECQGLSLNGTVSSMKNNKYQVAASFCAPAYIEVGIKKQQEEDMYTAKLG